MKVRIIKNHKKYTIGEVVAVTPNVAFGLIDSGVAQVDRMYTAPKTGKAKKNG